MADDAAATAPPPPARRWRAVALRAGRLAVIGGVLWLGWETVRVYRAFLAGPQPAALSAADLDGGLPPSPAELLRSLPPAGAWSVPGIPWKVEIVQLPAGVSPDLKPPLSSTAAVDRPVSDRERSVLAHVKKLFPPPRQEGPRTVLTRAESHFRADVVLAGAGAAERLVLARWATPGSDGAWLVAEVTPALTAGPLADAAPTLLPMPPATRCLARRGDRADRPVGEVAFAAAPAATLLQLWRERGWTVGVIESAARTSCWLCRRGEDVVCAWGYFPPGDGPAVLLLVLVPPSGEMKGPL